MLSSFDKLQLYTIKNQAIYSFPSKMHAKLTLTSGHHGTYIIKVVGKIAIDYKHVVCFGVTCQLFIFKYRIFIETFQPEREKQGEKLFVVQRKCCKLKRLSVRSFNISFEKVCIFWVFLGGLHLMKSQTYVMLEGSLQLKPQQNLTSFKLCLIISLQARLSTDLRRTIRCFCERPPLPVIAS